MPKALVDSCAVAFSAAPMSVRPRKSQAMYIAMLGAWLLLVAWFDPKLLSLISIAHSLSARVLLILLICCLNIYWLLGTYYIAIFCFAWFGRKPPILSACPPLHQQPVAILYLTLNDFDLNAALSCIEQNYHTFHLYILDDSTVNVTKNQIDAFAEKFPDKVTVVRRASRIGFKAGSLNNALAKLGHKYKYFAVIDADGVIPPNFLACTVPYLMKDEALGFVQACNVPNPIQKSAFAHDFALGIIPLWQGYFGPRNGYGFVPFLGHSGLLRYEMWERCGGFPEIVAEDLAIATRGCELGYRGLFLRHIHCQEDFPLNYRQLRKQQEKYIKGGCEYLHKYVGSFIRSAHVLWFEKCDVIMSCGSLFVPFINLSFILIFCLFIYATSNETIEFTTGLSRIPLNIADIYLPNAKLGQVFGIEFYIITLLSVLAPIMPCLYLVASSPVRLLRLISLSAAPYLSLMLLCAIDICVYFLTKRATFLVTADANDDESSPRSGDIPSGWRARVEQLNYTHRGVNLAEILVGAILAALCLKTANVSMFGMSSAMMIGVICHRTAYKYRFAKVLLYVPFFFIGLGMILWSIGILRVQTMALPFPLFSL